MSDLTSLDVRYKAPGSSWKLENELREAPNELLEAPGMLPNILLAYSCSEIEGSKGDRGFNAGVKTGRADAPGRVREGLLVSNITKRLY